MEVQKKQAEAMTKGLRKTKWITRQNEELDVCYKKYDFDDEFKILAVKGYRRQHLVPVNAIPDVIPDSINLLLYLQCCRIAIVARFRIISSFRSVMYAYFISTFKVFHP